ncbi:MAG: hypothetical protein J6Y48_15435, partial [Clostridia bacterium]|nr:hypothetical protein [Clostridia bacterium]
MKRILALFLALLMFLPVFSLAEEDDFDEFEEEFEEEYEELDEEEDTISDEIINAEPVSEELQAEIRSALENADFVPTSVLDENNLFINR